MKMRVKCKCGNYTELIDFKNHPLGHKDSCPNCIGKMKMSMAFLFLFMFLVLVNR